MAMWKASLLAVAALAGPVALAASLRGGSHVARTPASEAVAAGAGLVPAPGAFHYRFPITPAGQGRGQPAELDSMITQLEQRVAQPVASPMEMGDLADLYLRRAQQTGSLDDYGAAEVMANRSVAVIAYPSSAPLTLAKIANARHDFRGAITRARAYLTHARSTAALELLASAHLALGELDRAAEAAEWAVAAKPASSAYLMRALVMSAQGRDAEAAFDFARAVAVEEHGDAEEAARLRTLWGRFLLRRGEWTGAEALFAEAVRIVPGAPLVVAHQGELALRTGHLPEARALLLRAFADGHQLRYLIDLGRAEELAGDPVGAKRTRGQVEKLVRAELAGSGLGHRLELVELLVDRGDAADLPEALQLAREEVDRRPSAEARFQLARALAAAGARREALDQVRSALSTGARDARLYELAARLERAQGNVGRADLYAREAARLDPGAAGWRSLGLRVASSMSDSHS